MLVLQRKTGQSFVIGDDIKVLVLETTADRVKIAIEAPKEIPIIRSELLDAIDTNKEASKASQNSISSLSEVLKKNKKN